MFSLNTHILAVDDSLNIRQLMVTSLQQIGFLKITTAADANEATKKLDSFNNSPNAIGLIISDLNMPGPSGLEFLKAIRARPELGPMPFILVTSESEKGAVIEAAMSGASGYVVKPFTVETLAQKIKDAWNKHYNVK